MALPAWCASGKTSRETLQFMGQTRSFHVFVPETLPPGRAVPLLLTLHGSGGNGGDMVDKWKDLAASEQIIVVGPDSKSPAIWVAPFDGPDFLHDIVERLEKTYPIDDRRVYLFGHSAGAGFALLTSVREPQYFAATAVHAGALRATEIPANVGETRRIPIAIFSGDSDPIIRIETVRMTRDALRSAGIPVSLFEIPGHDHDYYGVSSKINHLAWDYLKQWTLPAEPQYEPYDAAVKRSPALAGNFLGTWEGTLVGAGRPVRFVLKLANDEGGAVAVLVSPDNGDAEIPVTTVLQKDAKLTVLAEGVGGKYQGEINKNGSRMDGRWSQNGYDLPLKLTKKAGVARP